MEYTGTYQLVELQSRLSQIKYNGSYAFSRPPIFILSLELEEEDWLAEQSLLVEWFPP